MPKRRTTGRRHCWWLSPLSHLATLFAVVLLVAATARAVTAQGSDPGVVLMEIDERHLQPWVSYGSAASGTGCAETFLFGPLPKRGDYELTYQQNVQVSPDSNVWEVFRNSSEEEIHYCFFDVFISVHRRR